MLSHDNSMFAYFLSVDRDRPVALFGNSTGNATFTLAS